MPDLRRDFDSRDDLIAYCTEQFPDAAAVDDHIAETLGGRREAEAVLSDVDPRAYAKTRNMLTGAVTGLSPYLHHGVLSLAEVRDDLLERFGPQACSKLINELAWRDFFRRAMSEMGEGVRQDREDYKTGWDAADYADELPADIAQGETGIDFIDAMARELVETGYLHNQARMKLASYLVHWRKVRWQAGAEWFLSHLLDGDAASNNLSWQWVASTFSHKPYLWNQSGLIFISDGQFTGSARDGSSPFAGEVPEIAERLYA
ncbi:MAG: FAD-binding domain-containing protein [Planctomycetota bacterium]